MKRLIPALMALLILTGCASTKLPEKWASTSDAYPDEASLQPPEGLEDAYESAIFPAPYEDVYRAALISASQANLNVTHEDKSAGRIFAKRVLDYAPSVFTTGGHAERRYFYAVVLDELGPKSVKVTIMAKAQGACEMGAPPLVDIATLGTTAAMDAGMNVKELCLYYSQPHWATDFDHSAKELNDFMVLVRNNLIAAGLY